MTDPRPVDPAHPDSVETETGIEDAAHDLGRRADRLEQSENAPKEREEGVGPVSGVVP